MKSNAIVIGGGVNGLTAAILLAKKGLSVQLFEKGPALGGIFSPREFAPGFHSAGIWPHVSQVSEEVADVLGLKGLAFESKPSVLLPAKARSDEKPMRLSEERKTELGLTKYYDFMNRITPFIRSLQEKKPFAMELSEMSDLARALQSAVALRRLGQDDMIEFMRTAPMPLRDTTREYTDNPRLQAALSLTGCWNAIWGPWAPMGTLSLMWWQASLRKEVRGGAKALIASLKEAAERTGVKIHLNSPVEEILVEHEKVTGVRLANGMIHSCTTVVSSCDPKTTFLNLMAPDNVSAELNNRVSNYRIRGTMSVLHLQLKSPLTWASGGSEKWSVARLAQDLTEVEKAFDAIKYRTVAERPALEVWKASEDGKSISIAAFGTSYTCDEGWTDSVKSRVEAAILKVMDEYAPGITDSIQAKQLLSPIDLEREYGLTEGHVFHGEWAPDQLLMVRPLPVCGTFTTPISGLVLCGPGTHPGIGPSLISGALAAKQVETTA